LTFWSEEHRQPWQTAAYYAAEELTHTPNEFRRIHKNQWVTSVTALFDDMIYWDRCKSKLAMPLPAGDMTPMVVALDASTTGACSAIYAVTRHPDDEWDAATRRVIERAAICYKPPKGGKLDYTSTIEKTVRQLAEDYNVYKFVYDPYQLHKLCSDMRNDGVGAFEEFSQHGRRLRADKQLYDMIIHRQFLHSGDPEVREHIQNTAKKEDGKHLRFEMMTAGRYIDLAVAASMAVDECLRLNT